jgi:hypothetical protein
VIVALLAAAGASLGPAAPIAFYAHAQAHAPYVTLADVADLSTLPGAIRHDAGRLRLGVIGPGETKTASIDWLSARTRALMPALRPWLPDRAGAVAISAARSADGERAATPACLEARVPIPAGAVARRNEFAPAACDGTPHAAAFRFDPRLGVVRTTHELAAGELAPAIDASALAQARPGDHLTIAAIVGPVRVERDVAAVQPQGAERPVFVRAEDGAVFSAWPTDRAP